MNERRKKIDIIINLVRSSLRVNASLFLFVEIVKRHKLSKT